MKYTLLLLILSCAGSHSYYHKQSTLFYERFLTETASKLIDGLYDLYSDDNGSLSFEKYSPIVRDVQYNDTEYVTLDVSGLGTAVGRVYETYLGDRFYGFHGIRFATAETFQMPVPVDDPWPQDFMGGFDATYLRDRCPQASLALPVVTGSEDCLTLSVYTPPDIETTTYPVMVFIYGGAFVSGDVSLYIPSKLLQKDVIVVTIQYRVGTLGFLYSASRAAPGNMGLMDQVNGLRWVNKYIENFGGQKDSVTVFGQSAGSASTSWMQLTPQNSAEWNDGSQLLHRIIAQSGSALEIWSIDKYYDESIYLQAQAVGCNSTEDTPDELVACMKEKTTDELVSGYLSVYSEDQRQGGLGFQGTSPVVQAEVLAMVEGTDEEQELIVIPRPPLEMLENEEHLKVDVMCGSVRDEGSMVAGLVYSTYLVPNGYENDELYLEFELLPLLVRDFDISDKTDSVANSFRLAFLPNVEMGNWTQMSGGLVDLTGLLFLKSGGWKMARLQAEKNNSNNIFFYSFEFESDDSIFDWFFISTPEIPVEGGVTHADDLLYLFALPSTMDDREYANVEKMTTLWANFARYSDPTPDSDVASWVELTEKWNPYTLENLEFMLMQDEFHMEQDFATRWNHNILSAQN